jgi:hypothetical protein
VKKLIVYIEGGGGSNQQKSDLRQGFDQLLAPEKKFAVSKGVSLRLVCSGSRNEAYDHFINAFRRGDPETVYVLLVDSEEAISPELPEPAGETEEQRKERKNVNARARKDHLTRRDGWDLKQVDPLQIHLMVHTMETWIVADSEVLSPYYGEGFLPNQLPVRKNLEDEPKLELNKKLDSATKNSRKKGFYTKIKHAKDLLARINPEKVAARCPRFATFTQWLSEQIEAV